MEPLPENSQNSTKPVKVRQTQNRIVVPDPLFQRLKLLSHKKFIFNSGVLIKSIAYSFADNLKIRTPLLKIKTSVIKRTGTTNESYIGRGTVSIFERTFLN